MNSSYELYWGLSDEKFEALVAGSAWIPRKQDEWTETKRSYSADRSVIYCTKEKSGWSVSALDC